jgi:hypothetical protein
MYHLRFVAREPMLTGILKVLRLPPQCTFWRSLASLHLGIAKQLPLKHTTLATARLRFSSSQPRSGVTLAESESATAIIMRNRKSSGG